MIVRTTLALSSSDKHHIFITFLWAIRLDYASDLLGIALVSSNCSPSFCFDALFLCKVVVPFLGSAARKVHVRTAVRRIPCECQRLSETVKQCVRHILAHLQSH